MASYNGRYNYELTIGSNSFSRTLLAYDRHLRRHVAVKVLDDPTQERLFDDAILDAVKAAKHPNILSIYDASLDETPHHCVRDYVEGTSLRGKLAQEADQGPLPIVFAHRVLVAVGDAISFAHEQMQRDIDIRPEKVLVQALPRRSRPLASAQHEYDIMIIPYPVIEEPRRADPAGSPTDGLIYQPPELFSDAGLFDAQETREWANQYRLGILGYEMLLGAKLFADVARERSDCIAAMLRGQRPDALPELPPIESVRGRSCPRFLSLAIERMTRSDRSLRYKTFNDAVNAIAHRDLEVEVARDSYKRILDDEVKEKKFFRSFYHRFFKKCPDAKRVFDASGFPRRGALGGRVGHDRDGKWPRQYRLIKQAIVLLLAFKQLNGTQGLTILTGIADKHKYYPPRFYDAFRDALIETVIAFDKDSGSGLQRDELRHAWEKSINPGIDYILNYRNLKPNIGVHDRSHT
jgi:serine/threonine protein kinase